MADINKYQCLERAGLKGSTEAVIMVAAEQALGNKSQDEGLPNPTIPKMQAVQRGPDSATHSKM